MATNDRRGNRSTYPNYRICASQRTTTKKTIFCPSKRRDKRFFIGPKSVFAFIPASPPNCLFTGSALRASNEPQFTNLNSANRRQAPAQSPARKEELKNRDLGGFPMPWEILKRLIRRLFPKFNRKLTRTLTMPRAVSLVSGRADAPPGAKVVPYISFDAVVGRNSSFHHLTSEQRDEIGGVEYRALRALLWIVGIVSRMSLEAYQKI